MAVQNLTVQFDAKIWKAKTKKGFWIPKRLAQAFGWKKGKKLTLDLVITKSSGEPVFDDSALCVSGTEITNPKRMFDNLLAGEKIRVTACNPKVGNKKPK
jgi:hypothetical protein